MCLARATAVGNRVVTAVREVSVRSRSRSRQAQAGLTFVELIIVFVVLGLLLSITVRAVRGSWVASSRRSASRDVTAYLYRTRGIAIQQSRAAWLVRSGNILKIMVDSSGTPVQLGSQIDFSKRYGATLGFSPTPKDDVKFDVRGFAVGVTTAPKFIVALGGRTDNVCVTTIGKITTRSCP